MAITVNLDYEYLNDKKCYHTDIDGDGDKDCPYDFDDNTNHSSSGSIGNTDTESTLSTSDNRERITFIRVLKAILQSLPLAIALGLASAHLLSYLFIHIFGDEKGCSISFIAFAVLSVCTFVWLIFSNLS